MPSPGAGPAHPPLSQSQLAAWRSFLRAHTVITRALERELVASQRLPLAEYDVLVQLDSAPGGALRMSQLADQVLLSRSGLTRLVERLEGAGMVRRQVCPSDARGSLAVLTEAGRERLREAAPSHLNSVRSHFADALTEDQLEELHQLLERLLEQLPEGDPGEGGCSAVEPGPAEAGECGA